jgi:hypothetical protein
MAQNSVVINDTSYSGTYAPNFILPAIFGMDSVNKGVVYVKDGIKKTHTIGRIDFTQPWQPRTATPSESGGDIVVDGRPITPLDLMLYQEFNPRDFESHFLSEQLSPTLLDRTLPATFENYLTGLIVGRALEQAENMVWTGSLNYANNPNISKTDSRFQLQFFDGLLRKMIADASVFQVPSPVALTSVNIGTALMALYQNCATNNKALITNAKKYERMKFLVSVNTCLLYEDFLTNSSFKNNNTTEKGIMKYKGFEVVALAGLPDNTIVFTEALSSVDGNLVLGTNSILDDNFLLARVMPSSENFFVKMLMKMDTQYGFANKVFMYTTLTSSSFVA